MRRALQHAWVAAAAMVLVARCGGPSAPSGPPPPPIGALELMCPTGIHVDNVTGSTQVTYPPPTSTGGLAPISTTCSPTSGALFPIGATTVNCSAADAATPPRTAACSFIVTLTGHVPALVGTTFMAFGDSITAGENGIIGPPDVPCTSSPSRRGILFIDGCNTYPIMLENLLVGRYTSQEPTVINSGVRGETTGDGLNRLPGVLASTPSDALLLLEGVNDLPGNASAIVPNLRSDIQVARGAGVKQVFLSTLIPLQQKPGSRFDPSVPGLIAPTNVQIRALATEQGVVLVDNEAAFLAVGDYGSTLLEDDGEHPTPAGYQVIAQTFFQAIEANFEQPQTSGARAVAGSKGSVPLRPHVEIRPPSPGQPVGIRQSKQP